MRFLPLGCFLYVVGGMLFGYGVGSGKVGVPSIEAVVTTGIGATLIVVGYFVLRPMVRQAKAEIKALRNKQRGVPQQ